MRNKVKCAEPCPVRSVEEVVVIRTKAVHGQGTKDSPARIVVQYWTLDGKQLAKIDHWEEGK